MEEMLPVVDELGNVIGKAGREDCHTPPLIRHPVVHLHVFNDQGEIFLQKRSKTKKVQPGKWDTAVGGHIGYGEDKELSLEREAFEEIGIRGYVPKAVKTYLWSTEVDDEFVYMFKTVWSGPFKLCESELADGRFWSVDEIREHAGSGIFTPNLEHELSILDIL